MAERRMFTKKITDSDAFIEMSSAAQALYFHLNQGADDDGFNNQIQVAMLKAHASTDDLKILMAKNFVIRFESGVIVIKHWRMHNTLRKDRYTPTNFQEEFRLLGLKENGAYTIGCQTVAKRLPQVRLGKDSTGKVNIGERKKEIEEKENPTACARENPDFSKMTDEELADYGKKPIDFSDEAAVEIFERYVEETEKRANTPSWVGKIIIEDGQYVRMKSHAQLIKEQGVSIGLRESLYDWLRSCYANGHLVTNRQLEDTIFRLQEKYGDNEAAMIEIVQKAAYSGYKRIVI